MRCLSSPAKTSWWLDWKTKRADAIVGRKLQKLVPEIQPLLPTLEAAWKDHLVRHPTANHLDMVLPSGLRLIVAPGDNHGSLLFVLNIMYSDPNFMALFAVKEFSIDCKGIGFVDHDTAAVDHEKLDLGIALIQQYLPNPTSPTKFVDAFSKDAVRQLAVAPPPGTPALVEALFNLYEQLDVFLRLQPDLNSSHMVIGLSNDVRRALDLARVHVFEGPDVDMAVDFLLPRFAQTLTGFPRGANLSSLMPSFEGLAFHVALLADALENKIVQKMSTDAALVLRVADLTSPLGVRPVPATA